MISRRKFIQTFASCITILTAGNIMGETQNNIDELKDNNNVYMYNGWIIRADDLISEEK